MLALVTGSNGFIGSQLCRALVANGHRVRASHRASSKLTLLNGLPDAQIEHAIGDITQPQSLEDAMQGIEVVFHAAAQLGTPLDISIQYQVTVAGTRNVLQSAGEAGVRRVVHTSSVAALGIPDALPTKGSPPLLDEHHTWNYRPAWWRYGHTKYLAELEVQKAVAQGLDAVIVNPAIVLGAGDLNRVSGEIILQVARGQVTVVVSGGLNAVHIEDVVRGHLAALERGRTGERYILGGENLSLEEFLSQVAEITQVEAPRVLLPAGLVRSFAGPAAWLSAQLGLPIGEQLLRLAGYYLYYDTRKARQELGWEASRSVKDAIRDGYKWYLEKGMIQR
jgi:dihydroflavonol-4-reductase